MSAKIVVAGTASLYLSLGVRDFPVTYAPTATPRWMGAGVSGAAGHIARVLRSMGDDTRLCTVIGRDAAGVAIRAELDRVGLLGPGAIETAESSLGVVLADENGYRMGFPYLVPADRTPYPFDALAAQARGADLLVLTNTSFVRALVEPSRALAIPIATDVHLIEDLDDAYNRPWLQAAQVLFCSHERLPEPPISWVASVFGRYPKCRIVGIGLGDRGAMAGLRNGQLIEASAVPPKKVVNTMGAGDSLFATFLHEWLRTRDSVRALELAVVHASWKTGHRVPAAQSLSGPEIEILRRRRPPAMTIGRWDEPSAAAAGF
jgi:sugar/nucleoside kinase (ribokinase family)